MNFPDSGSPLETTPAMLDLSPDEYYDYYATYLKQVPQGLSIDEALNDSMDQLSEWLARVPQSRADYAYAEGKWTVAQALQHVLDTERVFGYRALTFGRGDAGPLPGYDQDAFVATLGPVTRPLESLIDELELVRAGTRMLFESFDAGALVRKGTMSGHVHSVRAIGYVIAGHCYHHVRVYEERYADWALR